MTEIVGAAAQPEGVVAAAPALDTPVPPIIAAALVEAWAELEQFAREQTADAGSFAYKYADLGSVLKMARPILARHGLAVIQPVTRRDLGVIEVETIVLHTSGHMLRWRFDIAGTGSPQQLGSAITYARRYSLQAALGVAAVDDDGQAAKGEQPAGEEPRPRRPRTRPASSAREALTRKAMAMFSAAGLGEREDRLAQTSGWLNRDVGSWNDLTDDEMRRVIGELEQEREEDERAAALDLFDEGDDA
jgi:hypothetical protein